MTEITLRPYQQEAVDAIRVHRNRVHPGKPSRGIINFATGLGKTYTAMALITQVFGSDRDRGIFIANARSLITQTYVSFRRGNPDMAQNTRFANQIVPGLGMVMGEKNTAKAKYIIGSIQTLYDKAGEDKWSSTPITRDDFVVDKWGRVLLSKNSERDWLVSPRMDEVLSHGRFPTFMIFDEAHHSVADETLRMVARMDDIQRGGGFPPLDIIGLTATPFRSDNRGLNNLYDTLYSVKTFRWAQKKGYLVPFATPVRVSLETELGMAGVEDARNWDEMVLQTWKDLASDRQVIVFTGPIGEMSALDVSKRLAEAFNEADIPAAHTDGSQTIGPDGEVKSVSHRDDVYRRFREGKIRVICSYNVGLEGLDLPNADCLFWMRSTENESLQTQAVGRILRLFPGKEDALIVDFTGNNLNVVPIGTLFGFKVDLDKDQYEEEEEGEEAQTLVESMDLVSMGEFQRTGVHGKRTVYSDAQIISKSGNAWYIHPTTQIMTLSPANGSSFVITPPKYGYARRMDVLVNDLGQVLAGDKNTYDKDLNPKFFHWYEYFSSCKEGKVDQLLTLFEYASGLWGNYCLWDIKLSRNPRSTGKFRGGSPGWALENSDLMLLQTDAVEYAFSTLGADKALTKRSKKWRSNPPSDKQRALMRDLGYSGWRFPRLSRGEASDIITYMRATPPVLALTRSVEQTLEQFIKDLKSPDKKRVS